MSNKQNAPYDVLVYIFKMLDHSDMFNCQMVCRAWYFPAHRLLLKKVTLCGGQVAKFANAIDNNTSPYFLAAVETIIIKNRPYVLSSVPHQLDKEQLKKLFFSFPNLTNVHVYGNISVFKEFTVEMCAELQKTCPKLDRFEVFNDNAWPREYCDIVKKLRPLLTAFDLEYVRNMLKGAPFEYPPISSYK